MLDNFSVLRSDPFSHTLGGTEWFPYQWLTEIIFYMAGTVGGFENLGLFSASIIALTTLTIWQRCKNLDAGTWVTVAVLVFVLITSRFRFMVRPHIFFFLMVSLLLFLIEKNISTGKRKYAYSIIPLILIWVNAHGSYPLAYFYIAAWSLVSFIRSRSSFYLKFFLILLLALILRPGSYETFISIIDIITKVTVSRTVVNEEFLAPKWGEYRLFWFYAITSTLFIAATWRKKKPHYLELLVFITTLVLAVKSIRYIALFALATAPYSAMRLQLAADEFINKTNMRGKISLRTYNTLAALIAAVIMVYSISIIYSPRKSYEWGVGINENFYPTGAVDFLDKSDMNDIRLYNSKEFGGYLTWKLYPRFKVAIDGRDEIFGDLLAEFSSSNWTDYLRLMKKYRFQIAVIDFRKPYGFEKLIGSDTGWALVYWDDISLVYARRNEVPEEFISRFSYEYFTPFSMEGFGLFNQISVEKARQMSGELKRASTANPGSFKVWFYLGYIQELTGELAEAVSAYEKALQVNPKLAKSHYNIPGKIDSINVKMEKAKAVK